jgi:hypothetical protein
LIEVTGRPALPNVTLVAVTSVAIPATVRSLQACIGQAEFARVLLLTDQEPPDGMDSRISWRRIDRLASREDYSRFMLRDLFKHIETSHALCVQWDGFVLDAQAWDPSFLDYDYIGAVWPQFDDGFNVGNGGFSLRSKRLLEACSRLPEEGSQAEDIAISRVYRPWLEGEGIRFAPANVARQFAFEREPAAGHEFGFHGSYNLVRFLSRGDATNLFRSLEPSLLARNERYELLRFALGRGWSGLAMTMLVRLLK